MQHSEGNLEGSTGQDLFFQYWQAEQGTPRALILLAHGAGEHGGRYAGLAAYAVAKGYALAVVDHYGNGRSGGKPGFVGDFENYLDDFGLFHSHMAGLFPGLPLVLLGHSLGGLIAGHYLLRSQRDFACAALSGALVMLDPAPGAVQRALLKLLGSVLPHVGVAKLDASGVSRDPAVVAAYAADPLVFHGSMSARLAREMFAAMDDLRAAAQQISVPLMIMHGEMDVMTAPAGSRFLHDNVASQDKSLIIYPGLYHEIFNEPEHEAVWEDLFTFLDARAF